VRQKTESACRSSNSSFFNAVENGGRKVRNQDQVRRGEGTLTWAVLLEKDGLGLCSRRKDPKGRDNKRQDQD